MPVELTDFHFIRPMLLWLFIPALLAIYLFKKNIAKQSAWQNVISPHLLPYLFNSAAKIKTQSTTLLNSIIACVIIIAISGPSFRQQPVPVYQAEQAKVILLDLSLSMDATDLRPSRVERAKFKLMDILEQTNEGTVALVVYAGDAFIVSPLTSDANTIASMIPTLSTGIMPVLGSRPDIAISKSIELLNNAKANSGEIIWLTDGVDDKHVDKISRAIKQSGYQLSILAVGTEQGAPIPLPDGNGFLKDNSGSIVIPKLNINWLNQIVAQTNAGLVSLTSDNSDIEYLQRYQQWQAQANAKVGDNQQAISKWVDDGYPLIWLVLLLFFIQLIKHPSGQMMSLLTPSIVILFLSQIYVPPASALEWQDLWLTKNQQAQKAFASEQFDKAAELFDDPEWQASAQYKQGDFESAAKNFDPNSSVDALYNHATSLAKAGKLEQADEAFKQLLAKQPDHEDGLFNKKVVEEVLKQQQQQQHQDQNQDGKDQKQEKQDQQSQDGNDPNSQDQQKQDQQQDQQNEQQQNESEASPDQQQDQQKDNQDPAKQQDVEVSADEREQSEKDQALEHWLEKIPDDPGGLLRRKMYREYQRRGREQTEDELW